MAKKKATVKNRLTGEPPVPVYQSAWELGELLAVYKKLKPAHVLTIGELYGGTLWHWLQNMPPGGAVVVVDLIVPSPDHRHEDIVAARALWPEWAALAGVELVDLPANSRDEATLKAVEKHGPFDFLFIDGGHYQHEVEADFANYRPMVREGGVIAFHDIDIDERFPQWYGVRPFWQALVESGEYETEQWVEEPGWWGIGVVHV